MRFSMTLILMLITFGALSNEDPCSSSDYPIINSRVLTHATSYELPSIFYEKEGVRVILPIRDAIAIVKKGMSDRKPYLRAAKEKVLSGLGNVPSGELVDSESLWVSPSMLPPEELNVGIHVMYGYTKMFEIGLFEKLATVEVEGKPVGFSDFKYMVGSTLESNDEFNKVHKVLITSSDRTIYESCWLDR